MTAPLMSEDDLARLEALLAEATPGPWYEWQSAIGWRVERIAFDLVARCEGEKDARMIAALRNAAPALLAEVRRLREVEEAAVALVAHYDDGHHDDDQCQNTLDGHTEALRASLAARGEVK